MKLQDFAESIALKINKEESIDYIESLKFDILGYRASIISDRDVYNAQEIYYQYLNNFKTVKEINILEKSFELITIPKLIAFKNGKLAIKAFNKIGTDIKSIDVLTLEQAEYINGRRFTSKSPYLILDENILLAKNFKLSSINGLTIGGIFNNPLEVIKLDTCNTVSNCIEDNDLEIEDNLYQKIVIFLYKQLGIENNNQILTSTK